MRQPLNNRPRAGGILPERRRGVLSPSSEVARKQSPEAMKPKGRPDKDGFQRFIYPTPGTYMAIDRANGKRVKRQTPASITIPEDAGAPAARNQDPRLPLKHLQKFAFKSPEHRKYFGMRSLVESATKTLKSKNFEDLANVSKRSGRGFAFNYLAATLAAVSSNLRKIFDYFVKTAERDSGENLCRERRRTEAAGTPLTRHIALPALAPPQ